MRIVKMCPCCGDMVRTLEENHEYNICEKCNEERIQIDADVDTVAHGDKEYKEELYQKYLYNNPKFNKHAFDSRIGKIQAFLEECRNIPHCPICNSTDLSNITLASKVGKIAMFGIFGMGDNGKTWKCNNCGSKF